jgi:hypothetical protein
MKASTNRPSKICEACSADFYRHPRDSASQWSSRRFCSISCRNRSTKPVPVHLRFWRFVTPADSEECWIWSGSKDPRGYGTLSAESGSSPIKAYRLAYEMRHGPIPDGLVVRHKCDNPSCVNPDHLEVGTQKDNVRDMVERGRANPSSLLNLRPGAVGHHGAGPLSNGDIYGTRR